MTPTPATPLYMSADQEPIPNGTADTSQEANEAPMPPYIPGGFPRNGMPTKVAAVTMYINLFLASLYLALGVASLFQIAPVFQTAVEIMGLALSVWFVFYIAKSCTSVRIMGPLLLIAGAGLTLALQTVIPTALLLCVFLVISHGSAMMAVSRRSTLLWIPLIPISATILALLICRQMPALALTALLPWPTALVVSIALVQGNKRRSIGGVGLMCVSTLILSLTLVAIAAGALWSYYGAVNLEIILEAVESIRTTYIQELLSVVDLLASQLGDEGAALMQTVDEAFITDYVNAAFNLLPGTFIAALNVLSFLMISALTAFLKSMGYGPYISREMATFRMSVCAAVSFILSFFLSLMLADSATMVSAVAQNILLIFQPGLAFCGFATLTARLMHRQKRSFVPYLLLILAVAFFSSYAIMGLAVYGAGSILFGSIAAWMHRHNPTPSGH